MQGQVPGWGVAPGHAAATKGFIRVEAHSGVAWPAGILGLQSWEVERPCEKNIIRPRRPPQCQTTSEIAKEPFADDNVGMGWYGCIEGNWAESIPTGVGTITNTQNWI